MNRVCYYIDVGNRCMQENVRTKIAAGEETEREGKLLLYQWRTVNCKMLAVNHL